jgi:UPF0176 protein
MSKFQIVTFYQFKPLGKGRLSELREQLKAAMRGYSVKGTIIIAEEGFNSSVAGTDDDLLRFIEAAESILETKLEYKTSHHEAMPFRRIDVKIKSEIVTLKQPVDIARGANTHVDPRDWNSVITDPETFVLDARNDYEFQTGTFRHAVNPVTEKFSELPQFVKENLDPAKHKRVAMFCTGGIRCEKFAPYMKQLGFDEVYQLKGGILKYLEEVPSDDSLWQGECFVFDDRVSVDMTLTKGNASDLSQRSTVEKSVE